MNKVPFSIPSSGPFPLLWILVLLGALLGLIWLALPVDGMDWLVPGPEAAAESLLSSLGAHRYEGAMDVLSEDLRRQVEKEDLIALVDGLEKSPRGGIQDAHGQDAREQENTAAATVEVKLGDNSTRTVELPMVKEDHLWKVSSIEPVRALGQ